MKTQVIVNKEKALVPPSLLEGDDRNSDNESEKLIAFIIIKKSGGVLS